MGYIPTMKPYEYDKLKKRIEAEYREKLNALELVWKMSLAAQNGHGPAASASRSNTKTGLAKAMRDAIMEMSGNFTLSSVEEVIRIKQPNFGQIRRQSMATAIGRMEDAGLVETVTPGKGKTEAVYRLKGK